MPPYCKALEKADKKYLQELIKKGKVDTTKTANGAYINQVKFDHFRHGKTYNFCCNFRFCARSRELKEDLSGYC